MSAVLTLKNVCKSYPAGENTLSVLQNFSLELGKGEIVALIGPSGCGKTTLLQIAGLLDTPDSGEVWVNGVQSASQSDEIRTKIRLSNIGFVYQFHHLLPEFSALENVLLPLLIAKSEKSEAISRATQLLENFGLGKRLHHRPAQLSGGEQQRVAIARALANTPSLLLADEPTGNLDPETAQSVFRYFIENTRESGLSALMVTHNPELASKADRQISLLKNL